MVLETIPLLYANNAQYADLSLHLWKRTSEALFQQNQSGKTTLTQTALDHPILAQSQHIREENLTSTQWGLFYAVFFAHPASKALEQAALIKKVPIQFGLEINSNNQADYYPQIVMNGGGESVADGKNVRLDQPLFDIAGSVPLQLFIDTGRNLWNAHNTDLRCPESLATSLLFAGVPKGYLPKQVIRPELEPSQLEELEQPSDWRI